LRAYGSPLPLNPLASLRAHSQPEKFVPPIENELITRLPAKSRLSLMKICEPVALAMAEFVSDGGEPIRYVYFPIEGYISLVTRLDGKPVLEVGGRRQLLLPSGRFNCRRSSGHGGSRRDDRRPDGLRGYDGAIARRGARSGIDVAYRKLAFRNELGRNDALRQSLSRYLHVTMTQLAGSAACLRFHQIGPRLARWLLMSQDRARSNHFRVTHEFLAFMLGVRRVGVTTAAATLQRQGLVKYHRGDITVFNRQGFKAAACSCYESDRKAYAELLNSIP
jgi:Crp-like helix-turn-helix domain